MKKFVWDTSASINIKEPNASGYSPAHSLLKDLSDGWIPGPYLNIYPTLVVFEVSASVSRKIRESRSILREFYLLDDNAMLYDLDVSLIRKCTELFVRPGFDQLRGADLVFASIAHVESATLVTLDDIFQRHVGAAIDVLDLNDSRVEAVYRERIGPERTSGK